MFIRSWSRRSTPPAAKIACSRGALRRTVAPTIKLSLVAGFGVTNGDASALHPGACYLSSATVAAAGEG